jgi:exodeoxyribonuclease V alpha subunit
VERIFYTSPDFTAGLLVPSEPVSKVSGDVSFAGRLAVAVNDRVILHGEWTSHEKFGLQVKVARFEFDQGLDARGLAGFLSSHPDFKGLGPAKAKKLADTFGADFGRVLEEEPGKVAEVAGLSDVLVAGIRKTWLAKKELNVSMTWLASFDLTHYQQRALIERFGNSVSTVLKSDPYIIVQKVRGFGFKRADEIARKMGIRADSPERLSAALVSVLDEKMERAGDCFVEREELLTAAHGLLAGDASVPHESVSEILDAVIQAEGVVTVKFTDAEGDCRVGVGLPQAYECEVFLKDFFARASGATNEHVSTLDAGQGDPDGELQGRQKDALEAARSEKCLLITGGAGSGKTFTIASIVRMYAEAGLTIALAAPTGKAARRIEEVASHPALTIHRLLEYGQSAGKGAQKGKGGGGGGGGGFARNEKFPIEQDVLIVDEVSMLDVQLARSLFRAVDLSRTSVVLVGDPNQLPPVGPGNLLRDLIRRKLVKKIELTEIIRQAGVLRENSSAILRSIVAPSIKEPLEDGTFPWNVAKAPKFKDTRVAHEYVLGLFAKTLHEKLGFDLLSDVQVLTPTHKGALGTLALNLGIQALVQKKLWGVKVAPPIPDRRPRLYVHDRVIQIRNDYETSIMNGTVGNVVALQGEKTVTVDFDGEEVVYERAKMRDLELAYALTIHKSQGSEFPCVVLVIHGDHAFQHHRNLFYTGVTRARRSVFLVGDPEGMIRCVRRGETDRRRTFLSVLGLASESVTGAGSR